jgi:hypothetical protein
MRVAQAKERINPAFTEEMNTLSNRILSILLVVVREQSTELRTSLFSRRHARRFLSPLGECSNS